MPVMQCDLLVIGAGPYDIATVAYAKSRGLDAEERPTFKAFVNEAGFSREQIRPLPISVFLEYSHYYSLSKTEKICPRFLETIPLRSLPVDFAQTIRHNVPHLHRVIDSTREEAVP